MVNVVQHDYNPNVSCRKQTLPQCVTQLQDMMLVSSHKIDHTTTSCVQILPA